MAEENQDGQEKTEEPSQRKIDKHKEDGKVLSSKEMFVFTGIAGALLLMYAFSFSFKALLFEWGDLFVFSGNDKLEDLPTTKSLSALFFILKISADKDFVVGKSSSLSFPEKTKRSPHSNNSALKLNEKAYISSNAPAMPVKTNISLELRTFPSSLCLSILRWEGSKF